MSEHVWIALIAFTGTILSPIVGAVCVVMIHRLEQKVNHRMDELLEEARRAAILELEVKRELDARISQ